MHLKNITTMSYLQQAKDMYAMTGQGQMMVAFEIYYHEDVVMVEATVYNVISCFINHISFLPL